MDESRGLLGRAAQLPECHLRVTGGCLPQGELRLGLETRDGCAELMSRIRNEALLCCERKTEALEQLVHGVDEGTHLLWGLLFGQSGEVAM
jgi:hypothetical protein